MAPIAVAPGSNTTAIINGNVHLDPGAHNFIVASGAATPGGSDLLTPADERRLAQDVEAGKAVELGVGEKTSAGTTTNSSLQSVFLTLFSSLHTSEWVPGTEVGNFPFIVNWYFPVFG